MARGFYTFPRCCCRALDLAKLSVIFKGAIIFLSLVNSPAHATEIIVLGDSIGQDLARTMGVRTVARTSVSLRKTTAIEQMNRIPKGAVAILSLGLNDAADPVSSLKRPIERIISAALLKDAKFVWIGPPCVLKRWDRAAKLLDAYLQTRLSKTRIQYVSLRDKRICQRAMRTRDGEHFTPRGYRYVWQKIRRDSTFVGSVGKKYADSAK